MQRIIGNVPGLYCQKSNSSHEQMALDFVFCIWVHRSLRICLFRLLFLHEDQHVRVFADVLLFRLHVSRYSQHSVFKSLNACVAGHCSAHFWAF
jgi:hypothetical protein